MLTSARSQTATALPEWQILPRDMEFADIPQVLVIERAAYSYPWSEQLFIDCLKQAYFCWVLEQDGHIIAYTIWSLILDEAHLMNLCVAPTHRRQGWAHELLQQVCQGAAAQRANLVLLEVRPSNLAAVKLYQNNGFCEVGLRKDYYPAAKHGCEDALLMAKVI